MSEIDEYALAEDRIKGLCWVTKDRRYVPIADLKDSHLRNIGLFLIGMGYTECVASPVQKVAWLTLLAKEWQRRMLFRAHAKGTPCTFNQGRSLESVKLDE